MQLGHYLDCFMESMEAAEANVVVVNYKVASTKMLACEAKGRASEVE